MKPSKFPKSLCSLTFSNRKTALRVKHFELRSEPRWRRAGHVPERAVQEAADGALPLPHRQLLGVRMGLR
ncbi:hypothetical protein CEXT_569841 [Caerostris extrusa]|uniref:Uncharacterized protein n=1 Tax=Caerostris extrusa TaxID=172846 RepID=A0AAV4VU71_CAEEX|nr:hypothetical protein CEXT_569841 [Caerostris extrusa]